ncbi:MAG: triphosphoribosyl-dephospho-CoA synthase [Desulfobacterales bacterium]|nr:triphosphoribosyl-dephospho-CoA synthase [Desulfobacterales bacterium]
MGRGVLRRGSPPGPRHRRTGPAGRRRDPRSGRPEAGARTAFGPRREAMQGFPAIRAGGAPAAGGSASGLAEDGLVVTVLLEAMAEADDTCLVARGGLKRLNHAGVLAGQVLDAGGPRRPPVRRSTRRDGRGIQRFPPVPGRLSRPLRGVSLPRRPRGGLCSPGRYRYGLPGAGLALSPLEPFVVEFLSLVDKRYRRSAENRSISSICQTIHAPAQLPGPQLSRGTMIGSDTSTDFELIDQLVTHLQPGHVRLVRRYGVCSGYVLRRWQLSPKRPSVTRWPSVCLRTTSGARSENSCGTLSCRLSP